MLRIQTQVKMFDLIISTLLIELDLHIHFHIKFHIYSWCLRWPNCLQVAQLRGLSDHCAIVISVDE